MQERCGRSATLACTKSTCGRTAGQRNDPNTESEFVRRLTTGIDAAQDINMRKVYDNEDVKDEKENDEKKEKERNEKD